jgi:hypothetical protein
MIAIGVQLMLALAAASLGLRVTSVLIPRINAVVRLIASLLIGAALVVMTFQISDAYHVHDLGLGLLLSLSPVGIYDLAKWWIRR